MGFFLYTLFGLSFTFLFLELIFSSDDLFTEIELPPIELTSCIELLTDIELPSPIELLFCIELLNDIKFPSPIEVLSCVEFN